RSDAIISIALVVLSINALTFPFSEVTENSRAQINCADDCKVYTNLPTKGLQISKARNEWNEKSAKSDEYNKSIKDVVASFDDIAVVNPNEAKGIELPAGSYYLTSSSNSGYSGSYGSSSGSMVYIVSRKAPNYGAPVFFTSQEIVISEESRSYQSEYPRLYATGFDALGDMFEGTSCTPVYQARFYSSEKCHLFNCIHVSRVCWVSVRRKAAAQIICFSQFFIPRAVILHQALSKGCF
ncbi:hypothetical protein PENTCL1PPCAC_28122, partial [Pristionchus entomophagus]